MFKYRLILGFGILIPSFSFAQQFNISLNHSFKFDLEKSIIHSEEPIHSTFQPIIESDINKIKNLSTLLPTLYNNKVTNRSFSAKKLFFEHFVHLDSGDIYLTVDPLVNFEFGTELESDPRGEINYFKNTRGFNLKLRLGEKVNIESSFRESQAVLPYYLDRQIRNTRSVYGQGRLRLFNENGYDFAIASAYVSYSPLKQVTIQAGHDKHFIGNGYRSILLSDLAFNYPYLRIISRWANNKIQYQNLFTIFQNLTRVQSSGNTEALFERKQGAFHYLDYIINDKLTVGLFEGTIFPSIDSSGSISVGANYWVPILGLNTLIEKNNRGNNRLGTNTSYKLTKKILLYNQLVLGNANASELDYLLGAKWFVHNNILLQVEYNTTSQISNNLFSNNNESLSTPALGRNYNEIVGIVQFKKNRWLSRSLFTYGEGDANDVQYLDLRQSYIINPSFNFTLSIGIQMRREEVTENSTRPARFIPGPSTFIYFGLSTNLQNLYFDY